MEAGKTALERAFELAATGHFQTVEDIRNALRDEGYRQEQIAGPTLTRQLREIIRLAKRK